MPFCSNCGKEINSSAKFCSECGAPVNNINSHAQRKQVYDGEIHKCPQCGEILASFVTVCPTCGYEIRGSSAASVVKEFAMSLNTTTTNNQKANIIRCFPIPNTKEDIFEFMILALSNIDESPSNEIFDAWHAKLEQAYQKARLSFGNIPEFQYFNQLYSKAKKQKVVKSVSRSVKKSKLLQCFLLGLIGVIMMIIGWFGDSLSGNSESPFYMLAIIGMFPLIGAFALAISDSSKK